MERITVRDVKIIPSGVSKSTGKRYPEFRTAMLSNGDEVGIGQKLMVTIERGKTYDVEFFVGSNGKKSINKAVVVNDAAPVVQPKAEEKMTKADWNKKDENIKWLSCLKTAAEFHARREKSTIDNLIEDAIRIFNVDPAKPVVATDVPDDVPEGDVFAENGI